ncbi:zinc-dependent metalloprotease [Rhodococcus sp. HNM0563]|uniref:zinc-dependent metalloprotease n=1 Tax=unclassified Rhodococcus (in: high G+C Gram-positive bacteria) TaxID=192944 RepID=UPI00146B763D|nr:MULTISPECIES: zinc-dependent metalloprotease [unclassified Rhodococcus (in: high G+C Gram-positive bacteria)]MCK0091045.1 zinc-dependent metalloprotease [Rhodococcus sp. F64268]NLU60914.1 zinc-dependent metalloprotease [Rhodococcus sp. HNM0563]
MSDTPFGFSNPDDDPDRKKDGGSDGGASGSEGGFPFGFGVPGSGGDNPFGAQGFDPSQFGQMLSQFGQMLSGMGSAMGTGESGPVNYEVATKLARQQIGSVTPVSAGTTDAVRDAARLAELWLDAATTLPAGATKAVAWTPVDWLDNTLDTWKRLADPIAEQVNGMMAQGLPEEARAMVGPMMGMFAQMGGIAFGSQLGQALGQLSKEVLTSTDIGIPLGPEGTVALMPAAIETFGEGLEQPAQEVLVFLAARESAHQRLYSHVPWLRQRLLGAVEEYARGIKMDFSAIEDLAQGIDPAALTDPSKIQELLGQGAFEPQTTPEQKAALERLETMLALVEGWVEIVVSDALGDRLPGVAALSETLRRRRATGGPAEQTFASLVGLELRPRKLREAATLWRRLTTDAGADARDKVWAHPDLLPDSSDLDNPTAFVDRVIGGGTDAFDDPIAQLKATMEREKAERDDNSDDENPDASN